MIMQKIDSPFALSCAIKFMVKNGALAIDYGVDGGGRRTCTPC